MYVLLRALGFAVMVEDGLCPLSIKRAEDGKYFYLRPGGRYENDEDGERLPSRLVEDVLYEPDVYEGVYEVSGGQADANGAAIPFVDHIIK